MICLQGIHRNGGRKFAFLGVGDIGCVPLVKAVFLQGKDECFENITQLVTLHNKHLYKTLQHLEKELEGFVYSYADLYTSANQISNNPAKYGKHNYASQRDHIVWRFNELTESSSVW